MRLGTLTLALGLCSLSAVQATTIYSQAPVWTPGGTVGSLWTSHVDAAGNGWRAYDNFVPNASNPVNRATWYGVYLTSSLNNGAPNTTAWEISFYSNNAGVPGALLSSNSLPAASVTATNLGSGTFGAGNVVTFYEFQANVSPYSFATGTPYWFSAFSAGPAFYDLYAMATGVGGDGLTYQNSLGGGNVTGTFIRGGDRAFTLASVPEPSTYMLMASGLALLALRRRRR